MRIASMTRAAAAPSAIVLVGSLSACGGDDSDRADSGSRPLEVWSRSVPDPAKTYQEIMAAFTKRTGIEVDHKGVIKFDTQLPARASSNLQTVADVLEVNRDELVEIADSETALGCPPLDLEFSRAKVAVPAER
jgi:ABC-type glycerol-3-phosphate transport system substrate-binding protein